MSAINDFWQKLDKLEMAYQRAESDPALQQALDDAMLKAVESVGIPWNPTDAETSEPSQDATRTFIHSSFDI